MLVTIRQMRRDNKNICQVFDTRDPRRPSGKGWVGGLGEGGENLSGAGGFWFSPPCPQDKRGPGEIISPGGGRGAEPPNLFSSRERKS